MIAYFVFLLGTIILLIGAFGLIRLPDIYTRTHAQTVMTVGGAILALIGLIPHSSFAYSIKILLLIIITLLISPTSSHAIARAARKSGIKPWRGK